MASCVDDCLYYKVCSDFRGNICERDLCRFMEYRMTSDGLCELFKNKADVVEVKRGEWIDKPSGRYSHIASWCSVCGNKSGIGGIESNRHKPYCPNCGADMRGKKDG